MLEQQKEISEHLQQNLEQMSKHNLILKEISKTDQLTGLYNRWGFLDYVKTIIENPMNQNREVLVLYADMDNLKMINDKYGHDEGDFALREIGMILKEAFRNTDVISRFGGDEFVAFALLGIPNYEKIMKHRIAEITERHNQMVQKPYRIEMSIGICEVACTKDLDIEEVLEQADKNCTSKRKRRKKSKKVEPTALLFLYSSTNPRKPFSTTRLGIITICPQVWHFNRKSMPTRWISHVFPPHGCGFFIRMICPI